MNHRQMAPRLLLCLATFGSSAYAADFEANHIYVVGEGPGIRHFKGSGKFVEVIGAELPGTVWVDIAFGPQGYAYVARGDADQILVIDASGQLIRTIDVDAPTDICFGSFGNLFVTSRSGSSIEVRSPFNAFLGSLAGPSSPVGLAIDPTGHFIVPEYTDNPPLRIFEYESSGYQILNYSDMDNVEPAGVVVAPNGAVYMTDRDTSSLVERGAQMSAIAVHQVGMLGNPAGLAMGPDGNIYVASVDDDTIYVISPEGDMVSEIGDSTVLSAPRALAFAPYRLSANISGTFADVDGMTDLNNENATLCIAPGSGVIMLEMLDTASPKDLASLLGESAFVFRGFEHYPSQKEASYTGSFSRAKAATEGTGSIALTIKGKLKVNDTGFFKVNSVSGTLIRVSGQGSLRATVKAK